MLYCFKNAVRFALLLAGKYTVIGLVKFSTLTFVMIF